ncbi:endospore germination permease [Paenibacillaceae bacterium WGS1546]|uniref:GerAB/ArcD/ProY family transporter n=1 Tax=Cohnella sp. WGS1546 TaxID=3366810 RepID=UPI00372D0733
MDKTLTITSAQLANLLIAFTVGSAIVYIPNPLSEAADNDAWLALIPAWAFGILVMASILYLYRRHDGASLIEYSRRLIGRFGTLLFAVPLTGMFLFAIPAIVTGIGDFFTSIMMKETPAYVFNGLSLFTAALTVRAGLKVMARMFMLLTIVMIGFSIVVIVLAIPTYQPAFLLPVMPDGIKPLIHGAFIVAGFPFGEVLFFSMLLPFVQKEDKGIVGRRMFAAVTVSGALLTLSTLATLMTFGPAAGYVKYSLFRLAGEIQIADIFQRLEMIIGIALILGSFMKASVFLLIFNRTLVQLVGLRDERILIYPTALVCLLLSLTMFESPAEFNAHVYAIWPFTVIGVGCLFVFLLASITMIKGGTRPAAEGSAAR